MDVAFASKSEEKKSPQTSRGEEVADTSAGHALGAANGIPLFLQLSSLVVGDPRDRYEDEADHFVRQLTTSTSSGDVPLRTKDADPETIQRKCAGCAGGEPCADCQEEDEEEKNKRVQLKALPSRAPSSGALVGDVLPTDGATPLASTVREKVEPVLGVDLSHVQVHTGPTAEAAASALGAKAFTHQHHIWLGAHQSPSDVNLLAHESVHVVQQAKGEKQPELVQRQPVDEEVKDGAAVQSRMQQRIDEALGRPHPEPGTPPAPGTGAPVPAPAPPAPGSPAPAPGPAKRAAVDPEARRAAAQVDRSELAQKKGELQPEARPPVDRAAQEQPRVDEAARTAIEHIDAPPQAQPGAPAGQAASGSADATGGKDVAGAAEAVGKGAKKDEGPGAEAAAAAQAAAGLAEQAFATADSQSAPDEPSTVAPPPAVDPVDAKGHPLPPDPAADFQVLTLADQAQELRERGLLLRQQATEARGNAEALRGNLGLVQKGISQSDQGAQTARNHLAFRRDLVDKANTALGISEQKASTVADQAPAGVTKSAEGKGKSGPLSSGARDLAAENAANAPDDAEAAQNAQEQGGKLNQVGSDSGKVDDAMGQAQSAAGTLVQDAAQATQVNTQTRGRIDGIQATLDRTDERLGTMEGQNAAAQAQLDGYIDQPDVLIARADELDAEGRALIEASQDMEAQLHHVQQSYAAGMRSVPGFDEPQAEPGASGPEMVVQRSPDDGGGAAAAVLATPSDEAGAPGPESAAAPGTDVAAAPSPDGAAAPQPINIAAGLPSWLTGEEDQSTPEAQRAALRRRAEEDKRRHDELEEINRISGGHFERLSAAEKMNIAVRQTGNRLFGGVSNISWPGWGGVAKGAGHLAVGLIDPRGPLMGVVGGVNMIVNGVAAFYRQPSWGGALKMAADIATGLTIILGSITALAGVIIAIMTAITIISLGTAAPITGPVIAFCATVMSTVGTWTLWVGAVALLLQELVFLKDLYAAATAKTANELQQSSERMTEDAKNAGTVVMQVGMAKLAQVGGRALQAEIRAAGGGVRFAAQAGARGLPARVATGVREAGVAGYARSALGSTGRGAVRSLRGLAADIRAPGVGGRVLGSVKRGARDVWKGLTEEHAGLPPGESGLSRDFLVGKKIEPGGLRAAAAETRAATREKLIAEMRARGELPPAPNQPPTTPAERGLLEQTGAKPGASLTQEELDAELQLARRAEPRPIKEPPYVEEVELPNGHRWRKSEDGRWCRFSDGPFCVVAPPGTPTPAIPKFTDAQNARLNRIGNQLEELDLHWTDVGFADRDAVARFFAEHSNVDEAIANLEAQVQRDLAIKATFVKEQRPFGPREEPPQLPNEPPTPESGVPSARAPRTAGQPPPRAVQVGPADIADMRQRYGFGPTDDTLALARTDAPGLSDFTFEGASPRLRETAAVPRATPEIVSPRTNLQFTDHAEQDIANHFVAAVERAGLTPADLEGRVLAVHISNPQGVCSACAQGLTGASVDPGVILQLSQRYPGLTIRITWPNAQGGLGGFVVVGGRFY